MHYKKSLSYFFNTTKTLEDLILLIQKVEKKFLNNINRHKVFLKREWTKNYGTEADFSSLVDSLLKIQIPKVEDIIPSEVDQVLFNTLKKFGYTLIEDSYFDKINDQLRALVSHDKTVEIDNKKYSLSLHNMLHTIKENEKYLNEYKTIKHDETLEQSDRGTAFSNNRNASEVTTPVLNALNKSMSLLEDNEEIKIMSSFIEAFNKKPYDVVTALSMLSENTLSMINDEKEKEYIKMALKVKKLLNASQGLDNNDFYHSMKFRIASYFPFGKPNKYGFSSADKFTDFLNNVLEHILNIKDFTFDKRDFNQEIQMKDIFQYKHILFEKVTPTNGLKHPIFEDDKFIKQVTQSLKKTIIYNS